MITLADIALSSSLRLEGEFSAARAQTVRRTFGGLSVQSAPLAKGRPLTLVATLEGNRVYGYYTRAQVEAIRALEVSGAVVLLSHYGDDYQVIVQAGGIAVDPVVPYADPSADDWYVGTITMIEV